MYRIRDGSRPECGQRGVAASDSASANASAGDIPAAAAIQHVIGAAVRSEAWAATPASCNNVSISAGLGAGAPAAAAKAATHSSVVTRRA